MKVIQADALDRYKILPRDAQDLDNSFSYFTYVVHYFIFELEYKIHTWIIGLYQE